ncbi:calpastatin [Arthrobacter sp. ZBG10]|uniref:DUF1810 domain-containing protein n=1 Tax=Arthrobacter sp. ZBG10 TaxID=1676590 RepID=UPI00067FCCCE|nr:calpastatin [Arthrobacter sp. ZBG10]
MSVNASRDLERFVTAQEGGVYDDALAQLRAGSKTGHWMWFVFPQITGLGQSPTSRRYAINSLAEARAYLRHGLLGPRLLECTAALMDQPGRSAVSILGSIDARKLKSAMTLFLRADPGEALFQAVLDQFFDGVPDAATDSLLAGLAGT